MEGLRNLMAVVLGVGGLMALALLYGALKGAAQEGLAPDEAGEEDEAAEDGRLPEIF